MNKTPNYKQSPKNAAKVIATFVSAIENVLIERKHEGQRLKSQALFKTRKKPIKGR